VSEALAYYEHMATEDKAKLVAKDGRMTLPEAVHQGYAWCADEITRLRAENMNLRKRGAIARAEKAEADAAAADRCMRDYNRRLISAEAELAIARELVARMIEAAGSGGMGWERIVAEARAALQQISPTVSGMEE
jgi:hypothetical protein